jgi:multidrug resistance efflux pump
MSIPIDAERPVSERRAAEESSDRNGAPTLRDRVRSLRLQETRKTGGPSPLSLLPWGLCVILLGVTAAFGYRAYTAPAAAPDAADKARDPSTAAPAKTSGDVASSGEVAVEAKGYIMPAHQIQVSPLVGGRLVWLNKPFEEGRRFQKDDVLAKLEDVEYRSDYENAERAYAAASQRYEETLTSRPEEIKQAEADLAESAANCDEADKKFRRVAKLRENNIATQEDYDAAEASRIATRKRMDRAEKALDLMKKAQRSERQAAAKADMEAAKAMLRKAEWRLEQCIVKAPVSGTIIKKAAEEGNYVNPSAFSSGISASLCDMADLSDLEVDVKVQERDVAKVFQGQRCTVMPQAYQNVEEFLAKHPHGYEAMVSRLLPSADRGAGAVPVRVKLTIPKEEEGVYLRPDMGADVSFKKPEKK